MGTTNKELISVLKVLDDIIDNYKENSKPKKKRLANI